MTGTTNDHHLTETVLLPFERRAAGVPGRPPLPVAQVYPTQNLTVGRSKSTKIKAPKSAAGALKFFAGAARKIDDDPFLQRLARLN